MKVAIVEFPGAGYFNDAVYAYKKVLGFEVLRVPYFSETIPSADFLVVPGGSSFGDYLRPGALAKSVPVSAGIRRFSKKGAPILGIGNGFQILCELGILPGCLLMNEGRRYVGERIFVKLGSADSPFTQFLKAGQKILNLPISCRYGCYYADRRTIKELQENGRVALFYCDEDGDIDEDSNPTGSLSSIAGVINRAGNVVGIMPHPELAVEELFGSLDGRELLIPKTV